MATHPTKGNFALRLAGSGVARSYRLLPRRGGLAKAKSAAAERYPWAAGGAHRTRSRALTTRSVIEPVNSCDRRIIIPATNAAVAGPQAKVMVAFNTGCSYRAGSNIVMYGYANRTCGSPAIGDGTNVKSLPLDITATLRGSAVALNWNVATESGISSYLIERSTDARIFSPVVMVAAGNEPGGNAEYSATDESLPQADKLYYRIRISEQDGSFAFSRVAVVRQALRPAEL